MISNTAIGLASELRVMAELVLRGFNPAKSYLDNGVDIILDNGVRIQVKGSSKKSKGTRCFQYRFCLKKGDSGKKVTFSEFCDFVILYAIPDNVFWIIPAECFNKQSVATLGYPGNDSRYKQYENNWDSLLRHNQKGGENQ